MDQNRADASNQQQNVHLHMHQVVCGCHNLYPTPAYYPPVSYRTPPPPMMTYNPQLARPYLQHYQYTQFNQYSVPLPQVSSTPSIYSNGNQSDILFGASARERRERLEAQDDILDGDKSNELSGYDYGHVSPPPSKEFLIANSEDNMTENFVKFLERSCITAEQIAHRNRNRPCFRNIQNLCVRTRSEILKPCTTVSNIHSQGIPWATKDFIYAFVRLTNCWHILRGYWENRDGTAIGKITKELTPEFRECYVRWEKETIELASQLTKVFYNLDTNINCSSSSPVNTGSVHAANNLIPPQVNLIKNLDFTKSTSSETTSVTATASSTIPSSKPTRGGMLHVPTQSAPTATVDQANQTCSGDFYSTSKIDAECAAGSGGPIDNSEEECDVNGRNVYMKPGSYSVPKRTVANNTDTSMMNGGSPRTIEFLETAQNVNKVMEAANDRYWANTHNKKVAVNKKDDVEPPQFNVQTWLITSQFSDYDNASTGSSSPPNTMPYYLDSSSSAPPYGDLSSSQAKQDSPDRLRRPPFTVLQREKSPLSMNNSSGLLGGSNAVSSLMKSLNNGRLDVDGAFRRRNELKKNRSCYAFEDKMGGLTDAAIAVLEKIVGDLKTTEFADFISQVKTEDYLPPASLDLILTKLKSRQYKYVNEVVRDLYYVVNYTSIYFGNYLELDPKVEHFIHRMQSHLEDNFNQFDFSSISGHKDEFVGPLKFKSSKFEGDGDYLN